FFRLPPSFSLRCLCKFFLGSRRTAFRKQNLRQRGIVLPKSSPRRNTNLQNPRSIAGSKSKTGLRILRPVRKLMRKREGGPVNVAIVDYGSGHLHSPPKAF